MLINLTMISLVKKKKKKDVLKERLLSRLQIFYGFSLRVSQ